MKLGISQGNYFPQSMLCNLACFIKENFEKILVSAEYFVKKSTYDSV